MRAGKLELAHRPKHGEVVFLVVEMRWCHISDHLERIPLLGAVPHSLQLNRLFAL